MEKTQSTSDLVAATPPALSPGKNVMRRRVWLARTSLSGIGLAQPGIGRAGEPKKRPAATPKKTHCQVKNENSPFDGGFRRYRFALALLLLCRAEPIRASHESFQMAGGKGRRLLNPPIEADGHMIYLKPALRRAALKEYLAGIGGVSRGN